MDEDLSIPHPLRVLLRQERTGLYLQPSGDWSPRRDTARTFKGSLKAYLWAKDRQFLGTEVLLASANPRNDFVAMRVHGGI